MNTIIQGDALSVLKGLPDGIVQTCVTSPPYLGLRDYGTPGQIGLEATPDEYVAKLVAVFREVKRVLRTDGTLWLNLGDSYSGSGKGGQSEEKRSENWQPTYANKGTVYPGLKPKDLIGIPWMVAFALRADGWYLRSDCIWNKPNCMPESVEDRPTKSHEYLFLLSKSERYYYDSDAIREPHQEASILRDKLGWKAAFKGRHTMPGESRPHSTDQHGFINPNGRNKRSVWTIPSQSYSEAHFATFPPKLIEPCILAGTSPRACEYCGSPWERVTEPTGHVNKREIAHVPNNTPTKIDSTGWAPTRQSTDQWQPTCTCPNEGTGKCIILDPFIGAGTTALVAIQHGRNYLGIDLNVSYVQLAEKRIATVQQNLWTSGSEAMAV